MTFSTLTSSRLPGIRSFVKRSDVFRKVSSEAQPSASDLIAITKEQFKRGRLRAGETFPNAEEISKLTGASLVSSLDVVTALLNDGLIRQHSTGRLVIAPLPVY